MRNDRVDPYESNPGVYPPDPGMTAPQPAEPYMDAGYPAAVPKRSNKHIIRLIALLVIISALLIILQSVIFRLKTVSIVGSNSISAEYITSLSGLQKGESIVTVSEDVVRANVEKDHWLVLLKLYKQYPSTVYLVIKERKVVAVMQWLGIEYTLDIDGMVMDMYPDMDYENDDIPTVYGFRIGAATVGEPLAVNSSAQLIAYSAIVSELSIQRYTDRIKSVNISNTDELSLLTKNGITVELGNSDYMRAKIGAMRTDIAYLQQLGEASGVLDVTLPEEGKFKRE